MAGRGRREVAAVRTAAGATATARAVASAKPVPASSLDS